MTHKKPSQAPDVSNKVGYSVGTLYVEHKSWLLYWLNERLGCVHNAADIAHDTFVRVLQKKHEIESVRTPRAWLRTIAKRLIIDKHRRQQVEDLYLAELASNKAMHQYEASPEEISVAVDTLNIIAAALEQSTPIMRETFMLRFFENWTHQSIADHLGVSTKTVQNNLAKVLVRCQLA